MTSTWGEAWASAWGDSWGAMVAPPEPELPSGGGGGGLAVQVAPRRYRVTPPITVEIGGAHYGAHYGVASLEVSAEIGGASRGESTAMMSAESLADIGGASRGQSRVMASLQAIDNRRNARTLALLLTVLRGKP